MTPTLPFVNWELIHLRVAESLHIAASDLPAQWQGICSSAAKDASAELQRIFVLKGYAVSRLADWDDRLYYAERLATWFALCRGTALASYDTKTREWLDPRKELTEAAALVIGGSATAPALGESDVGGIASGQVTAPKAFLDPCNRGKWGTAFCND